MPAEAKMIMGGMFCLAGLLVTLATMAGGGTIILAYGAIIGGAVSFVVGAIEWRREEAFDDDEPSPVIHPPRLVSGEIFADDYPPAALRAGEEGTATVAFTVGRDGRVRDAELVGSSGSPALDEATCRLIAERFVYAPAKDLNMNPLEVRRQQTVNWTLPAG